MSTTHPAASVGKPKYQAIADDLAQAIVNGQFGPGEKLPPHRVMAKRLGVTAGTISRAYASLERQSLALARVGDGTYVAGDFHNHTTCSDGSTSMQKLVKKVTDKTESPWGLDWFVQAGHGGNGKTTGE